MLKLPEELNHASANACLAQLAQGLVTQVEAVVVDAQDLQRFDSSALAVLLEVRRLCESAGQRFAVRGLPRQLQNLATLYGIEELLPAA
ncbi:MAG: STAS domain-containing protein [Rhodoferax sp.]